MKHTTAETLTRAQIRGLLTESGEAGDRGMVAICERALGTVNLLTLYRIESAAGVILGHYWGEDEAASIEAMLADAGHDGPADPGLIVREFTRDEARAECARVIADAEAMDDEGGNE